MLLGNGDGTFEVPVTYDAGVPTSVAVADVNGDGNPDLLVANWDNPGTVAVLLGKGDGTFEAAVNYGSGGLEATSIAVADVNGDHKPDLLVANWCDTAINCPDVDGSVGVLLGNGDGTFQAAVAYDSGGHQASAVAVADVNGDGKPDLAVTNWDEGSRDDVAVLLGNGDGTFQSALTDGSGAVMPAPVVMADVNGDGSPDLIVGNLQSYFGGPLDGIVGVLLNNTPFCTTPLVITVFTTPTALWPPNGNMIPVTVSGTITETGCTVTSAAYAVTDEYGQVQPSGPVTLGLGGAYSFTVLLQASRLGNDLDGRLYTITVSASNNAGKMGSQAGPVIVPHDQGH